VKAGAFDALSAALFALTWAAIGCAAPQPVPARATALNPNPLGASPTSAALPPMLTSTLPRSSRATPTHTPESETIVVRARPVKIAQLIGDFDKHLHKPTLNLTWTRYKLAGTDLGIPFKHKNRIYLLFGDTIGQQPRGGDAFAYTTDTTPDDGLALELVADTNGVYQPIRIPGISQGAFEVPSEGVSVSGRMYIYHTTDSNAKSDPAPKEDTKMGRSVVAVSDDDGQSFKYLYDLSIKHFINVSIIAVDAAHWAGLPSSQGAGLVIFGSGDYRRSNVRVAFQPAEQIGSRANVRYFAGLERAGQPTWSAREEDAVQLFDQPCVGEFSVSYNRFIRKWIMLYNCMGGGKLRGINLRTADHPWGPWSAAQVLFEPWDDKGYCHFIHTAWTFRNCDNVHDANRENVWGGEYGPYQFEDFATGDSSATTIYFTLSTWNPYTVVLMKATLQRK
jgi:hypothetical protein